MLQQCRFGPSVTLARAMRAWLFVGLIFGAAASAQAVIIEGGDGSGNTTAPSDDPGWANVGSAGASCVYLGNGWVITAAHVGLGAATFNGVSYNDVPNSFTRLVEPSKPAQSVDLCMFQLQSNPVGLSQLTVSSTEPANNSQIVAIGYGANRATSETYWDSNWNVVSSPGVFDGYYWASGNTKRWGTNNITHQYGKSVNDGYGLTDCWETVFSSSGDANQMQAAGGDSGGGVFYKSGSSWDLTGIILAIGTYGNQPSDTAVFGNVTYFADLSRYAGEISQIMAKPEPLYWSGTGTWDQGVTANWSRVSGGLYNQTWAGGNAVFEGSPGIVTVASSGVSSVNSIAFTTDGYTLSGSGTITMTGPGGNISTAAGTDTINCTIGGSVGLTKGGSGTLVLTGANTYTGLTTISAGTLQIGNGGTTGSIVGDVTNLANLAFNRSDTLTYGGNISGTGGLTQLGSGTLILTNAHSNYTGTTTVADGKLQINGASSTMNVLTNAGGANVTGGALILDYSAGSNPATTVKALLASSDNGGVNAFQSGQLRDSSASDTVGLGWADSPTINGHTYTNQIVVMPALYGDANLDSVVDGYDLGKIIGNYNKSGMTWSQGDFNYDGAINGYDLAIVLGNYAKTGPVVINVSGDNLDATALGALRAAGITPVPEPGSFVLLALASSLIGLMAYAWQRRRQAA